MHPPPPPARTKVAGLRGQTQNRPRSLARENVNVAIAARGPFSVHSELFSDTRGLTAYTRRISEQDDNRVARYSTMSPFEYLC